MRLKRVEVAKRLVNAFHRENPATPLRIPYLRTFDKGGHGRIAENSVSLHQCHSEARQVECIVGPCWPIAGEEVSKQAQSRVWARSTLIVSQRRFLIASISCTHSPRVICWLSRNRPTSWVNSHSAFPVSKSPFAAMAATRRYINPARDRSSACSIWSTFIFGSWVTGEYKTAARRVSSRNPARVAPRPLDCRQLMRSVGL